MARHRQDRGRSKRVLGAGSAVGAFLAFGMGPLASAPAAQADVEDVLFDLFGQGLGDAFTGLNTNFADLDSWQVILDPVSWTPFFDGLGDTAIWDSLLADLDVNALGSADFSWTWSDFGGNSWDWNDVNWLMPFGDGTDGTAADPNGGAGGWIWGTGGAGWDADGTGASDDGGAGGQGGLFGGGGG
ncbi:MAG: hypothetical protein E6R04_04985, partial [Spirochaetes bacterium]